MQSIAQYWEQLLYTTGRALALEKFFSWPWCGNSNTLTHPEKNGTSVDKASPPSPNKTLIMGVGEGLGGSQPNNCSGCFIAMCLRTMICVLN